MKCENNGVAHTGLAHDGNVKGIPPAIGMCYRVFRRQREDTFSDNELSQKHTGAHKSTHKVPRPVSDQASHGNRVGSAWIGAAGWLEVASS